MSTSAPIRITGSSPRGPKLDPDHGRPMNRLYEGMLPFHDHFRQSFSVLSRVGAGPRAQRLSAAELRTLLGRAAGLVRSLEMHHHIEETYIFPLLAKRMPSFGHEEGTHLREHEEMHAALEAFGEYAGVCLARLEGPKGKGVDKERIKEEGWPKEVFDASVFEERLNTLGKALFPHLDAEEKSLRAESLRNAGWTVAEVNRIPL